VLPRGDRDLAIAISDRADGDFNTAFGEAVALGMNSTSLSISWDELETAPGVYSPNPNFLDIATSYYGSRGTRLLLGINPIDTNNTRVPPHLVGRDWDDPVVIDAFKALLDWAIPRTEGVELVALAIGNEIDASLVAPAQWAAYRRFFAAVSAHARSLRPGLRVSTKIMAAGLLGHARDEAIELLPLTDALLTTYYPLGSDFTADPPNVVHDVFRDIVELVPGLPVLFAEIGMPSSNRCGSSEAIQSDFITEVFAAWDTHADRVELLEFVWMHDISPAALDRYESYYGISDGCFLDYLATLGLKSPTGAPKPAWERLATEAADRGW